MSREAQMVVVREDGGVPKVWCDPEIADLIDALNTDKIATVASCSGHGYRPGSIALKDGRVLMVFDSLEHARPAEMAYPIDVNGDLVEARNLRAARMLKQWLSAPLVQSNAGPVLTQPMREALDVLIAAAIRSEPQ